MNAHEQRETFDALIRQHSQTYSAKLKELLELKDSIAEARKQGASYEIIRSYLRKTAISVSADTVARFCHLILSEPKHRSSKRGQRLRGDRNGASGRHLPKRTVQAQSSGQYQSPNGPRIVDPKNL
jgi:negative regulator of sigma E activity